MLVEVIFMMVILKLPIVYLCAVVWWAIRAEPQPLAGAGRLVPLPEAPDCDWRARRARAARRGPGPRGGRARRPLGPARVALARARGAA